MADQTKHNSLFWFGFFIALILVIGLTIYYYKDNKNKKLKDIKKQIEDFINQKLNPTPSSSEILPVKSKSVRKKPRKFIVKK